jgi:hypothetical protein
MARLHREDDPRLAPVDEKWPLVRWFISGWRLLRLSRVARKRDYSYICEFSVTILDFEVSASYACGVEHVDLRPL